MKFKKQLRYGLLFSFLLCGLSLFAKDSESKTALTNENRVLSTSIDLHLTDATNPLVNSTVNITSEEAWLFFDNMKPSKVLSNYKTAVKINGAAIEPFTNCRLVVYKQGSVVIPHSATYQPLETFTDINFGGSSQKYTVDQYYTNSPISDIPQARQAALNHDNSIRSIKLKRGYMATFANEPDAMGYSRIFIADAEDLEINLPAELDKKVSFIRVFSWEWVSKKGWCGGTWNEPELIAKNLAHGDTQSDLLNATWYYHWGSTVGGSANATVNTLLNQEFVPEKWGLGGNVSSFYTNKRWSHLLGYNEPDHSEQSNIPVEKAVEEWPVLLKTGARLGSPATTDFNWLYRFMDECKAKNYRVDYVVVHAYWGGKSPQNWYNDLKAVHTRTGRPIWIKEWNNGANWTTEGGWDGKGYNEHNANKQLNDLKGILQVLDTASFVERYSIYNWVEDCRQLIRKNGDLTKAGEYYASTTPDFAFNRNKEVIPNWIMVAPKLSYYFNIANKTVNLSWTDFNGELTTKYIIEQSFDNKNWEEVGEVNSPYIKEYALQALSSGDVPLGEVYYRIKTIGYDGVGTTSNTIKYDFLKNKPDELLTAINIKTKDDWSMYLFENQIDENTVFLAGTPTYRNRYPLVARARNVNEQSFELRLKTWYYFSLEDYPSSFTNPDTLAFLTIPKGEYQFGNVKLLADTLHNVGKAWKTVTFGTPFDVIPVVLATQISDNDELATAIRIRNITKTGFDVCRKYEQGKPNVFENIAYIAATPGSGIYDGKNTIEVGITANAAGVSYSNPVKIDFQNTFDNPAFFGFMQTCNDETAATLRLKSRKSNSAEVFKLREQTASVAGPAAEKIGYLVLGANNLTGINTIFSGKENTLIYDAYSNSIHLSNSQIMNRVEVYSVWGAKLISTSGASNLDVSSLQSGMYIAKVNGNISLKFIKQ
jgi:hypothetical protein